MYGKKMDLKRKKVFEDFARGKKKRVPVATTNPPKRGKPTRLPRFDRMKGM